MTNSDYITESISAKLAQLHWNDVDPTIHRIHEEPNLVYLVI